MQADRSRENLLGFGISAVGKILESSLKHIPVTEGGSEALNIIGSLVHPNIEERLAVFHNFLLQQLAKDFDLGNFLVKDEILESLEA